MNFIQSPPKRSGETTIFASEAHITRNSGKSAARLELKLTRAVQAIGFVLERS